MEIVNVSVSCPCCCKENFDSIIALKNHILDIRSRLKCPTCEEHFDELNGLAMHLDVCNSEGTEVKELFLPKLGALGKTSEEDIPITEVSEGGSEKDQFYCEICNIYFGEMKNHLMEYHMGQEVIVESQDFDGVLEESEVEENTLPETPDSEHIFLEQEVLDENRKYFTKKLTKINIVPNVGTNRQPIIENIVFCEGTITVINAKNSDIENAMRVFRCGDCNIRFTQFINYEKHNCDSRNGEVCDICSIYFATKAALTSHKRKLHGEIKPLRQNVTSRCNICQIDFPSEKAMNLHKKMHVPISKPRVIDPPVTYNIVGKKVSEENNESFVCHVCYKEYNVQYEEIHMRSHNEELFNCAICNRKFIDKDDLNMHAQAHGNEVESKISCGFCKKVFLSEDALTDHMENHCESRKYGCNFCGRKFLRPHEKVKHERIHTGLKPHICEVCGKGFRVSYCLTLHLRTHSGVRPYHCETCGKRFKSHSVFNHHIRTHSDARPYKCPFCPKAFKTRVQLAGHKNTHTKPFTCHVCNRPFATLYAVRLHTKSHERQNNLNHQCHICGAKYARNFALRDHLLSHPEHSEEDVKKLPKNKIKKVKKSKADSDADDKEKRGPVEVDTLKDDTKLRDNERKQTVTKECEMKHASIELDSVPNHKKRKYIITV